MQIDSVAFLPSSGDGHGGCFHVLAVVNDAPVLGHVSSVRSLHTPAWWGRSLRVMGEGKQGKRRKKRGERGTKKSSGRGTELWSQTVKSETPCKGVWT